MAETSAASFAVSQMASQSMSARLCPGRDEPVLPQQRLRVGPHDVGEETARRVLVLRRADDDRGLLDRRMRVRRNLCVDAAPAQRRPQRQRVRQDPYLRIAGVRELRRLRQVLADYELTAHLVIE